MSHTSEAEAELLDINNLIAVLGGLRDQVKGGCLPVMGICGFVEDRVSYDTRDLFYAVTADVWPEWPHFSGSTLYPVSDPAEYRAPVVQYNALPHWEGTQLELRLDLIEYTIRKLNERAAQIEV